MAITDINISETLEAGAPSIKYRGNMNPNMQMASASDAQQQEADKLWQLELKKMELDEDYIPEIIDPEEMKVASDPDWESEWEDAYQNYKLKQIELGQEFVSKEEFMEDYQNNMASGGRVNFGLGSIFKSVGKAAKKAIKSPIGKAALLGLGAYYMPGIGAKASGGWGNMFSGLKSGLFGQTPFLSKTAAMKGAAGFPGTSGILGKLGLTKGAGSMMPTALGWGATALGAGMGAQMFENMKPDDIAALKQNPEALRAYLKQYHSNTNPDKSEEEVDIWVEQNMYSTGGRVGLSKGTRRGFAFGPDQTAEAAGIMGQLPVRNNSAGVKELDLRDSGGFIPPVGVKEKADDIPAMLSNNEFVMTADAVRAAGGGSVEKGAQVMYDQMKNLENKVA